jgi:thiosulfate/3-mercaptopyruvate sulfurtransferase
MRPPPTISSSIGRRLRIADRVTSSAMLPPFVDPEWALAHRDELVLADVRWYLDGRSGRAAYDAGHVPGAVFVDLDRWLARPASPAEGRHPLPDPATFAAGMSEAGIGDEDTVVAYDDAGGLSAGRLVWMLRATGHEAALLDGGIAHWPEPLEQDAPARPPARFTPREWPAERLAGIEDAADPANLVLDARARERYEGRVEPVDPRPGHIPGARSAPAREHLDPEGRLLPRDELRRRLADAGVDEGAAVISSCGSGINACHTLLVLEAAGLPPGRLYPGSYSQWSHSDRPVATGSEPA